MVSKVGVHTAAEEPLKTSGCQQEARVKILLARECLLEQRHELGLHRHRQEDEEADVALALRDRRVRVARVREDLGH